MSGVVVCVVLLKRASLLFLLFTALRDTSPTTSAINYNTSGHTTNHFCYYFQHFGTPHLPLLLLLLLLLQLLLVLLLLLFLLLLLLLFLLLLLMLLRLRPVRRIGG